MTNTNTPEMTGLRIINLLKNKYALDTDKLFNNLIWSLESWKRKEGKNLLGTSAFFQIAHSFTNMHARFSNTNEVIAHLYFSAPFDEYNAIHISVEYRWKKNNVLGEITWVGINLGSDSDPTICKNAANYKSGEWPRFELESSPIELLNEMLRLKKLARSWESWPEDIIANEMAVANPQPMLNPKLVCNSELPNAPYSKSTVFSKEVPVKMVHEILTSRITATTEEQYNRAAAHVRSFCDWEGISREIEKNPILHNHILATMPSSEGHSSPIHPFVIRDYLNLASSKTTGLDMETFQRIKDIADKFDIHAITGRESPNSQSSQSINNWDKPREVVDIATDNPFAEATTLDVIGYQIAEYRAKPGWTWSWITQEEYYLFEKRKAETDSVKYHLRKVYGQSLPAGAAPQF